MASNDSSLGLSASHGYKVRARRVFAPSILVSIFVPTTVDSDRAFIVEPEVGCPILFLYLFKFKLLIPNNVELHLNVHHRLFLIFRGNLHLITISTLLGAILTEIFKFKLLFSVFLLSFIFTKSRRP